MTSHLSNSENIMSTNPLNEAKIKVSDRPIWLCKHPEAKVVSYDPRRFFCAKCDKSHIVKIVTQRDILGTLSTNSARPEHKD